MNGEPTNKIIGGVNFAASKQEVNQDQETLSTGQGFYPQLIDKNGRVFGYARNLQATPEEPAFGHVARSKITELFAKLPAEYTQGLRLEWVVAKTNDRKPSVSSSTDRGLKKIAEFLMMAKTHLPTKQTTEVLQTTE